MTIRKKLVFMPTSHPICGVVQAFYNNCATDEDLVELCYRMQRLSERHPNPFDRLMYLSIFFAMYSEITGLSYESKITTHEG